MREDDRDRAVDRLLRDTLSAQTVTSPSDPCVDGETLAAWTSGSLRPEHAREVERHLSDCARCQSLLATFVRAMPDEPEAHPFWWRGRLQWFVPLATAATAAAIWFAIPVASPTPPLPSQARERAEPAATESVDGLAKQEPATGTLAAPSGRLVPAEAPNRVAEDTQEAVSTHESRLDAGARSLGRQAKADAKEEAAAVAQPLSATGISDATDIESPGPGARWRIRAGRLVERSASSAATWEAVTIAPPAPDALTAGFAVSPTVCWVVGKSGAVYVTTDGMRFVRVTFPEAVDLVAVSATDARSATVTAADGRTWRTADQGRTWAALSR